MIQGGMNLVWTTRAAFLRAVRDRGRVFCDGAANEGVAGADTRVTAASKLRTREPRFVGSETDETRSGATKSDPAGRHYVSDELVHREPSGAWPEAPPPGF